MNKNRILRAYYFGCKLAEIRNASDVALAMRNIMDQSTGQKDTKIPSGDSMTGDDQYRTGDTWGHSREITLPSNMGVPSR
jgi:hypothetical protein